MTKREAEKSVKQEEIEQKVQAVERRNQQSNNKTIVDRIQILDNKLKEELGNFQMRKNHEYGSRNMGRNRDVKGTKNRVTTYL